MGRVLSITYELLFEGTDIVDQGRWLLGGRMFESQTLRHRRTHIVDQGR